MRQRIYVHDPETGNLRPAWSENVPASAKTSGYRGELVKGESDYARNRRQAAERKDRAA